MGKIVEFAGRSNPASWRPRSDATASAGAAVQRCEIIIFPGVRYERWDAASTPPAPAPEPGKKRRREKA